MPNHIFTCLTLSQNSINGLEAICRRFLWGKITEGNDNIPLVAWKEVLRPNGAGGCAITSFQSQSKGLRLKQFMKLMRDEDEDWIFAMKAMLMLTARKGKWAWEKHKWSAHEMLLATPPKRISKAPNTTGLLQVWSEARKHLSSTDTLRRCPAKRR
ncbi:hypothetical protein R1flu_029138 [Riccia fluitans]|uniref:Uncharacterized protein n=1 Tax=Riccia fluitans TaxID=41844 RepID=A0ABD1XNN5_9MARC